MKQCTLKTIIRLSITDDFGILAEQLFPCTPVWVLEHVQYFTGNSLMEQLKGRRQSIYMVMKLATKISKTYHVCR